jgi:hypothetical protein
MSNKGATVVITRWLELTGSGFEDSLNWFPTVGSSKGFRERYERADLTQDLSEKLSKPQLKHQPKDLYVLRYIHGHGGPRFEACAFILKQTYERIDPSKVDSIFETLYERHRNRYKVLRK